MLEQWNEYKAKCYPKEMPPEFEKEIRQAFWMGAFATLRIGTAIASLGLSLEEATDKTLEVHKEINDTCYDFAFAAQRRQ